MAVKYLHFKATNPVTGCPMGSFCTQVCSKSLSDCELYKALKESHLLNVYSGTNQYGDDVINVTFPASYGDVLIRKEYLRFSAIASECAKKSR